MTQAITKEIIIGDLIAKYPQSIEILMAQGVQCVGCGAAYDETLEQGLASHGYSEEELKDLLIQLNAVAKEVQEESDENPIHISARAAQKVKDFLKQQEKKDTGLRIIVAAGGCSGMQYQFAFETEKKDDDFIIVKDDISFYIDEDSLNFLKGARIDYVETLQGAGFKVSNPNAKSSCGCGQSFQ